MNFLEAWRKATTGGTSNLDGYVPPEPEEGGEYPKDAHRPVFGGRVRIQGLQGAAELNGRTGKIINWNADGKRRFGIQLEGPDQRLLKVKARNLLPEEPERPWKVECGDCGPLFSCSSSEFVKALNDELKARGIPLMVFDWTPIAAVLTGPLRVEASSGGKRTVTLDFSVTVRVRGQGKEDEVLTTALSLPPAEYSTVDELRAALLSLHESSDDSSPAAGGVLMRLPGATDDWSLPDDLWLNSCPYRRSIRDMFYTDVVECLQRSVADPDCPRLMRVVVTPPELNMEMDSYRVGTLLVRKTTLISSTASLSLSLFPSR